MGTSAPPVKGLHRYLGIASVNHACGNIVPDIGHGVVADAETQASKFLVELGETVVQLPKGLAPLGSSKHVLIASLGDGIVESGIYCDKLGGCLDIEVVHAHGGNNSLRIAGDGLSQRAQIDEEPYTVIIE